MKCTFCTYLGREGLEDSAVGIWSTGRNCEIAVGRSLELPSWTFTMLTRVRWGTSSSLCAVSCCYARFAARTCRVSLLFSLLCFLLFWKYFLFIHFAHYILATCIIATFLVQLSHFMVMRVSNVWQTFKWLSLDIVDLQILLFIRAFAGIDLDEKRN
jgi:hypothetical protein